MSSTYIYSFVATRHAKSAWAFLDRFIPERALDRELSDNPDVLGGGPTTLEWRFEWLARCPLLTEKYHFNNTTRSSPLSAVVGWSLREGMIFGLCVPIDEVVHWKSELSLHTRNASVEDRQVDPPTELSKLLDCFPLDTILDMAQGGGPRAIRERLRRVVAWCTHRMTLGLDNNRVFRSSYQVGPRDVLNSSTTSMFDESSRDGYWEADEILTYLELIDRYRIANPPPIRPEEIDPFSRGELLLFDIEKNLSMGEICPETDGLFDDEEALGWDTWIGLFHSSLGGSLLLCWVPDEFVDVVERALHVLASGSTYWLDDSVHALSLTALLRDRGIDPWSSPATSHE